MKTPYVIMARSAMSSQQKVQILSNELTRRMFNIKENNMKENIRVMDEMASELKNSEYKYKTAREIIISGVRGLRTRLARREQKGQDKYRIAHKTLQTRLRKKLTERENWYKRTTETDEYNEEHEINKHKKHKYKKKHENHEKHDKKEHPIKSVMYVPQTPGSELAKLLRTNEEQLAKITGNKVKIIERAGVKLQDILTTANPWRGDDCLRTNCLLCHTKNKTEQNMSQDCHKRSLVYETRCLTCERTNIHEIENMEIGEQEKIELKKKMVLFKYIGETSRSAYERGWEHMNDMASLKSTSHMLKHVVSSHPEQDMEKVEFGMKVLKYTQTSFERQIRESVIIQSERTKHNILNSRSEYNRCSLPRLCTQIGDEAYEQYGKEIDKEKLEEERIENKIRNLRKERNKARMHPTREQGPAKKRRKVHENEYINIKEIWGEPKVGEQQKNKNPEQNQEQQSKRVKINEGEQTTLTNLRTVEGWTAQGPIENNMEYIPERDWDQVIREHKEEIERQENMRTNRLKIKEQKEQAWALNKLCREFLNENHNKWAERESKREQERLRILRLEKAGIKGRKAKLEELKKNVKKGMEKLPPLEREQLEREEKNQKLKELQTLKKDLWTLKRYENKEIQNEYTKRLKEIRELGEKAQKIAQILADLRKKRAHEKEMEQRERNRRAQYVKEKKAREQLKREQDEKEKALQERWALLNWTTEYIAENSSRWDKESEQRELERKKKIEEWERKSRFEKIAYLKEKMRKKQNGENTEQPKDKVENWNVWRKKEPTKETPYKHIENNQNKKENLENENYKISVYLKPSKIKTKPENPEKNPENPSSKSKKTSPTPPPTSEKPTTHQHDTPTETNQPTQPRKKEEPKENKIAPIFRKIPRKTKADEPTAENKKPPEPTQLKLETNQPAPPTNQNKPTKIAPIFEKNKKKPPKEIKLVKEAPEKPKKPTTKNDTKTRKNKKNPAPNIRTQKSTKKSEDITKIEQRKKYWSDLRAKNPVLKTEVTQENLEVTFTRSTSDGQTDREVNTVDSGVMFLQTDGAHTQDEKAEISAPNTKINVDNPRPDLFESEKNPTQKWAKGKSLPD